TAEFSADSRTLVTTASPERTGFGGPPGWVLFWDVATSRMLGEPVAFEQRPYPVGFDATGETVFAERWLCDVKTREKKPLEAQNAVPGKRAVAHMLWGLKSPYPRLRNGQTGEPERVTLPAGNVAGAVISPDGRRLLTTHRDGLARLWDAATGAALGPPFQPEGGPYSQSPDGSYVLFTSSSTKMQIWNPVAGRQCGETLPDGSKGSFNGRFSPDGAVLATRWNWTAHLWDSASGQLLGPPIKLASTAGVGPVFSPDGRSIFVEGSGVGRWRVPPPAADDPVRLRLSVEVRTGLEVDENGGLRKLSRAQWLDRKTRLGQLGGPCDVTD
ncbi:MAG TPA: WD40 repeat domain-containing protein, partial [Urbifossiella sp.]|nr:WD40 repeat domain-containing protein [Urbifossiella sp.]